LKAAVVAAIAQYMDYAFYTAQAITDAKGTMALLLSPLISAFGPPSEGTPGTVPYVTLSM